LGSNLDTSINASEGQLELFVLVNEAICDVVEGNPTAPSFREKFSEVLPHEEHHQPSRKSHHDQEIGDHVDRTTVGIPTFPFDLIQHLHMLQTGEKTTTC
jgi:hypothetical protein